MTEVYIFGQASNWGLTPLAVTRTRGVSLNSQIRHTEDKLSYKMTVTLDELVGRALHNVSILGKD